MKALKICEFTYFLMPEKYAGHNWAAGIVIKNIAVGVGGHGFDFQACQTGHSVTNGLPPHCGASSKLCFLDAKPRRWIPLLVTYFCVIHCEYNEDMILILIR